jgi:hypothetical protein
VIRCVYEDEVSRLALSSVLCGTWSLSPIRVTFYRFDQRGDRPAVMVSGSLLERSPGNT